MLQGTGPRVLRYYASGWKTFTSGIELLPGVVRFDLDSGPDQQHTVVAGSHVYVPTAPTPPVVDAGVSLNVDEGGEILLVAGFVDVEASQAHSASVDWGDGSASQIGTVTQSDGLSGIVTANHVYVDDGVYTIEVCVTDNGNPDATGCSTVTATVANLAPTASITIIEDATFPGNQISLQAIATDPGTSDTLGYTWTVTHKAKVVATGTNPVIDFTPSEPGEYRVDLTVEDGDGKSTQANTTLTVPPAPPVVDAGVSLNVDEGGEILLVAGFVDVEASQAHSASVDWGDGSASQIGTVTQSDGLSGIVTANHVYVDDGVYTIEVCVTDNGNPDATGCSTVTATVANLAPTASITIIEDATFPGNQISLQAIATDPGTSDTLGYTWTVTHKAKVVATGTNPVIDFTPSEPGEYRVDLTVEDGDGKSTQANTTLTVPPAPPTTSAPPLPDPGSDPEPVPDPAPRPDPEPKTPHLTKSGMDAAKPSTGTEGSPPIGHPDAAGPSKTITGPATQAAETSVPESPGELPVEPTEEAAPISNQASDTDWAPALGWILAISAPLLLGLAFRRIRAGG